MRANAPVAVAASATACGPARDRTFAPRNDRATPIMPHNFYLPTGETCMAAYLISLALAGLVLIIVWEGLS